MREKTLLALARWHAHHPGRMLAVGALLTLALGFSASFLKQTMRWSDLLPAKDRRTLQYNQIVEEFVTATSIVVVVQGDEVHIKTFAEAVIPGLKQATDPKDGQPYVKRIDYMHEREFIQDHGLMLIKAEDLVDIRDVFTDPNLAALVTHINDSLEKEYVGREDSLSTREKEDSAFAFLDGIEGLVRLILTAQADGGMSPETTQVHARRSADRLLYGEPYLLSYDKTTLVLNVIPNFTLMDGDKLISGVDAVQEVIDEALVDHPQVEAGLTGMIPVGHDEMVYGQKSIGYTTFIALGAVFFLLVVSFRMWMAPFLALSNLLVGIVWAMGAAALLVGTLNIMTAMMSVILVGLGIDFSIHMISFFTERRSLGDSIAESMRLTFLKSGKGILTGGLTTSIAFLTMMISSSRGMKELGLVTGSGLLAILAATFLFLPALLVLRERRLHKRQSRSRKPPVTRDISLRFLGRIGEGMAKRFVFTLPAALAVTLVLIYTASRISFDQNYMNLEPKGLPSITLQDTILEKFALSMDYALILADSVSESRRIAEEARDLGSVAMTEDISLYFPSAEQQRARTAIIREIRAAMVSAAVASEFTVADLDRLREELKRLEMNVMEMQDMAFLGGQDRVDDKSAVLVGKPEESSSSSLLRKCIAALEGDPATAAGNMSDLQEAFSPYFKQAVIRMSSLDRIEASGLPDSIWDRYANASRSRFLVTVFPAGNIWQEADFLKRFVTSLEGVDDQATGLPPVFRALIEIIGRDGRKAMLLTLGVVFLLLLADYRHPGHALMAMVPLTIGVVWMIGFMSLSGVKLTVMNVMGLPMIIGIGVDDGVHIVHRWRSEGKGQVFQVFASTGKAILLTSITTMLAFGSLVFSIWRGFGSLGIAMFIGVGMLFLSTVVILAGILGWVERRAS